MRKTLVKVSASTFLLYGGLAVLVYFSLFLKELGLNNAQIGVIVSLFSWTALFSRPVGGKIADSLSVRTLLLLGASVFAFSFFGLAAVGKNVTLIVALRVAAGLGFAWYALGSLLQSIEGEKLGNFTSNVSTLSVFYLLPYFIYPYLAIRIAKEAGFSLMFLFGGVSVLLSLPLIISIKRPIRKRRNNSTSREKFRPEIVLLGMMNFFMGWSVNIAFPFFPLLEKVRPAIDTGLFFTVVSFTAVVIRAYVGRKFSFWGKPDVFFPGFFAYSLGFLVAYFAKTTPIFLIAGVLIGIGVGTVYPNITAMTLRLAEEGYRGVTMGFVSSMGDFGFCAGPIIFGYISYHLGLLSSFLVWAGVIAFVPLWFILQLRKKAILP